MPDESQRTEEGSPAAEDIADALLAHIHGGPRPEAVILEALGPVASVAHAVSLSPGRGVSRPTYALRIPALGLTVERQSVSRVAERLAEISKGLHGLAVGGRADAGAPEFLVRLVNTQVRLRGACAGEVRKVFDLCGHASLARIHAPVPLDEVESACHRALGWAEAPETLPPGALRLVREIRRFLDRVRLEAMRMGACLPDGVTADLRLPMHDESAAEAEIVQAGSAHAKAAGLVQCRRLGATLALDRDGWREAWDGVDFPVGQGLHLRCRIATAHGVPDVRLRLSDGAGRAVAPPYPYPDEERGLDSATLSARSLLHALGPRGLRRWMVDLSDAPGISATPFIGRDLAEALAFGSLEADMLEGACLARLLGRVAVRRVADPGRPLAFVALTESG